MRAKLSGPPLQASRPRLPLAEALAGAFPPPSLVAEARRLREPPEEVAVHACEACGGVSLARYGAGEPPGPPSPCLPGCPAPRLLRLRYGRIYSAP